MADLRVLMRKASAEEVLDLLRAGQEVRAVHLDEKLDLTVLATRVSGGDEVRTPIRFRHCRLGMVGLLDVQFYGHVGFEDCDIDYLEGYAAYFFAGFSLVRCVVAQGAAFQHGGHNRGGTAFFLADTRFKDAVHFRGSWYEGPVIVRNRQFAYGCDVLAGEGQPWRVRFDVPPVLEDNRGNLCIDFGY